MLEKGTVAEGRGEESSLFPSLDGANLSAPICKACRQEEDEARGKEKGKKKRKKGSTMKRS